MNEGEKEKTDQLKLKSANLEYKNLHLMNDIETCSMVTPNLVDLQKEMVASLRRTMPRLMRCLHFMRRQSRLWRMSPQQESKQNRNNMS